MPAATTTPSRLECRHLRARIAQLQAEQATETRRSAHKELGVTIAMLQARLARFGGF